MKRVRSNKDRGERVQKSTDAAAQPPQALAEAKAATAPKTKAPTAGAGHMPAASHGLKPGSVARSAGVDSPKPSKAPSVLSPPSGPPQSSQGEHPSPGTSSRAQSGSSPRGSSPADEDPRFQGE
jgi:hypothetical protein